MFVFVHTYVHHYLHVHKLLSLLYLHAWRPHVHFQTNPYYVLSTVILNDAKVRTMLYLTNFKS